MTPAQTLALQKHSRPRTSCAGQIVLVCKLRDLREAAGLSSVDVGNAVGVAHSTILNAEKGLEIRLSTALKLAGFFGVEVGEIWSCK